MSGVYVQRAATCHAHIGNRIDRARASPVIIHADRDISVNGQPGVVRHLDIGHLIGADR